MPPLLSQDEIAAKLKELHGWRHDERYLVREFSFPSFGDAMDFINRVAEVAEEINHHPDISVSYTQVTLSVTTHSEGGITRRDFRLLGRIDGLAT